MNFNLYLIFMISDRLRQRNETNRFELGGTVRAKKEHKEVFVDIY